MRALLLVFLVSLAGACETEEDLASPVYARPGQLAPEYDNGLFAPVYAFTTEPEYADNGRLAPVYTTEPEYADTGLLAPEYTTQPEVYLVDY